MCHHDVKAALAEVQAPTLVMHGGKSQLHRAHESMVAAVPGAIGFFNPDGGEPTPTADPETWTRPILEFLSGTT
jgi:hypothetical protein